MSKYNNSLYKIYHWLAQIPPKISWSRKHAITQEQRIEIAGHLASGYYIILTGSNSHLSSIMVSFLSWIKTGKWSTYSHALMNCDNISDPNNTGGFKFVEATSIGVHYSTFDDVFACDKVCLLTPKNIKNSEWTKIIDNLLSDVGKSYDDLFDLADDSRLSCVEVVLDALKAGDYKNELSNLEDMIRKEGNLVPQMYRDCDDFTVAHEV